MKNLNTALVQKTLALLAGIGFLVFLFLIEKPPTHREQNGSPPEIGARIYTTRCSACHGQNLQGNSGPNLIDSYWIHGKGTKEDVINMIKNGALSMGMPAWVGILSESEISAVSEFILSHKGSQPANAKGPQGQLF